MNFVLVTEEYWGLGFAMRLQDEGHRVLIAHQGRPEQFKQDEGHRVLIAHQGRPEQFKQSGRPTAL